MEDHIFSIIVADDEDEIRNAMCGLIDWKAAGFELIGSAANGLDALQMVEQLQPDLLLTDIQMPFITGTALARQVRELQPLIQVAFLTGYDDFEYARSAIDNQVISYLLKPISMAELTSALADIHCRMEERFRAFAPSDEREDLPLAVSTLLLDSYAAPDTEEECRRMLFDCGMVFTEPYEMAVLSLSVDGTGMLPQSASQIADNILRRTYSCGSFVSGRRIITLLVSEDGFSRLGDALDELYYYAKRYFGAECTLGVSRFFDRLERCGAALREASDAARLSDSPGVAHIGDLQPAEERLQRDCRRERQLDDLFFGGSRGEMEEFLSSALGQGSDELTVMQVLVTAQSALRSALGAEEQALLFRRFGLSGPLSAGLDTDSLRGRVHELCLEGQERVSSSSRAGMGQLVERTLQIIESQYMDESLSLGSVSEQLHVSPNYLSANMKKYAGDTFINLLIKKRMEAARGLIVAGGMKIGEVAQRCGYSDQHYFSFCFKKFYGVSPAKMRKGDEAAN